MSKKVINSPNDCVEEFISGLIATHRGLIKLPRHNVVLRRDLHNIQGKVAIISGGGSGHEPAHAGYVGKGMLTGAVCGAIFTSPPASSILAAIKAVSLYKAEGVLLIVTNYTGDKVNFGLAREWAMNDGIKVEMVIVGEDCALKSPDRSAGRRGLAGTILIHKIAGALSELGEPMKRIIDILETAISNMGTIGVCLQPCTLPGSKNPSFTLGENEMALGLGVHGEAGVKMIDMKSSSETVDIMLDHMMDKNSATCIDLLEEDEIVLMINNLGGTTGLEIGIITNDAVRSLTNRGMKIIKVFSGTYVTSLEMAGFFITILKTNIFSENISLISLLETKADTPCSLASVGFGSSDPEPDFKQLENLSSLPIIKKNPEMTTRIADNFKECIIQSCKALIAITDQLNEFDRGSGDGDCGSTHARGAEGVLIEVDRTQSFKYPASVLQSIGLVCSETMGGTSGAMYSILFSSIARKLSTSQIFSVQSFADAIQEGVHSVVKYGGAKFGDRTMLDVLKPISDKLNSIKHEITKTILDEIKELAKEAAQQTLHMKAKAGRASYVNPNQLVNPDPGAIAVAEIISASIITLKHKLNT